MARADLILELVENSLKGNKYQQIRIIRAIIAEERAKQHTLFADRLQTILNAASNNKDASEHNNIYFTEQSQNATSFIQEVNVEKSFDELILPKYLTKITQDFIEEQNRADILRSYGIEPRNKILLIGKPGTGKTSYVEALADKLMIPLYVVRYDSLIGSYLGETATRLRQLFDFASSRRCILFFDEFDTLGKERGDVHELGEIKRAVSSLLMMSDSLPTYSILIGASNHDELLDRAVWRRFQIRLKFPMPGIREINRFIYSFINTLLSGEILP